MAGARVRNRMSLRALWVKQIAHLSPESLMLADLDHPLEAQVFTRERERLGTILAIDGEDFVLAPLNIAHDKHVRRVPRAWVESVASDHAYLNRSMADVLEGWTDLPPPDLGRLSSNMMVYASDGAFVGNFLRVYGLWDLLVRAPVVRRSSSRRLQCGTSSCMFTSRAITWCRDDAMTKLAQFRMRTLFP